MYSRELDGETLTLAASGWTYMDTFVLYDQETNSLWWGGAGPEADPTLVCVAGEYQDRELLRHNHWGRTIWRSWVANWPETLFMVDKD